MVKKKQTVYFVQGNSRIRLNRMYQHYFDNMNKINPTGEKLLLSGRSLMNENPSITEAELLQKQLKELQRVSDSKMFSNENTYLHKKGIERLGCFLEAREVLDRYHPEETTVFMPIESLYLPSYTSLFHKITGHDPIPLEIGFQPTLLQKIQEYVITKTIEHDENKFNLRSCLYWEKYIEKIYEEYEEESNSTYVNYCWKPYRILKRVKDQFS